MLSSHKAPDKIAPRPVCQKYCPERMELRQGVQLGAGTKALVNNAPSRAMRSKLGVSMR